MLVTAQDYVREGAKQFKQAKIFLGHGTTSYEDEALFLVLYGLGLNYDADAAILKKPISPEAGKNILDLFARRILDRKPAAYLTKETYLSGVPFYVDENVLIPRSPIAQLIEVQFSPWMKAEQVKTALDLCTGSGCLAILMAKAFPNAMIDASDISPSALQVARRNVDRHHLQKRVHLVQSDVFQQIPLQQYDVIISNPPYVSHEEMCTLPKEYQHEPILGLEAADEGLAIVLNILKIASSYLAPQGILIVEVGNSRAALEARLPQVPFLWLSFERGGEGVFLLTQRQLQELGL